MSEFPPPPPTSLYSAAGTESHDGWWKRRSSITKGLVTAGVVVLGIGVVGSALAQAKDESAADPAPEVEAALEDKSVADPAPEVEAALEDEFQVWLIDHLPMVLDTYDDIKAFDEMLDDGLHDDAAKLSTEISATFFQLGFTAPETGTELSDVTNETFQTCGTAFSMAAVTIEKPNVMSFNLAKDRISECIGLAGRMTALIEP